MELSIVIPAYNESESLEPVLNSLKEFIQNKPYEVIIVNDGSKDNSLSILQKLNNSNWFTIVNNKVNKGYGGAIKEGIKKAKGKFVVTIDADGQHNLEDIDKLFHKLKEEDADMIVGARDDNASSLYRRVGKNLIRFIAKKLMPIHIRDLNSGMKVYNTKLAKKYMSHCPNSMAYSDTITLFFIQTRNLVIEEPISINQRIAGESTINYKTAITTVIEIVNLVMLFNPLKIFFRIGIPTIFFGIIWGLFRWFVVRDGLSTGALLAIITGLLLLFLGLIAESIRKLRMSLLESEE
ncbi:Glyco_trans_2-like domain-containing protein [Tenacibaculum sp. 190524A05c]|uniref:glycosyltransferase family 2 protein n=1 Tax=Tenacibaculum platacis TaxID=3137852 RepID=UPI0031FAE036